MEQAAFGFPRLDLLGARELLAVVHSQRGGVTIRTASFSLHSMITFASFLVLSRSLAGIASATRSRMSASLTSDRLISFTAYVTPDDGLTDTKRW